MSRDEVVADFVAFPLGALILLVIGWLVLREH